jgi:hypothetical protein
MESSSSKRPTQTTREDWDAVIGCINRELGLVREVPYSAGRLSDGTMGTAKALRQAIPKFEAHLSSKCGTARHRQMVEVVGDDRIASVISL